jgi:excisionase family DNA binding protein
MERVMFTVSEVANRWAVGKSSVYRLIQSGELPSIAITGLSIRINIKDLLDFEDSRRRSLVNEVTARPEEDGSCNQEPLQRPQPLTPGRRRATPHKPWVFDW